MMSITHVELPLEAKTLGGQQQSQGRLQDNVGGGSSRWRKRGHRCCTPSVSVPGKREGSLLHGLSNLISPSQDKVTNQARKLTSSGDATGKCPVSSQGRHSGVDDVIKKSMEVFQSLLANETVD
jgi:hypothetical protein